MISFGSNLIVVGVHLTEFMVQVTGRRLIPQYEETPSTYDLFAIDGQLAYSCTVWRGDVPFGVVDGGYTQEQNDTDKATFEGGYKALCNSSMVPKGSDGTPATLPCLFPTGVYLYISGAGDSDTVRGSGDTFVLTKDAAGDATFEWSYLDWVLIAGGGMTHLGGEAGDYCSMEIIAPATPVTANPGHTGNCNLVDPGVGAAILIVPANGDGDYDVDLDDAIPVPAWDAVSGVCSGFYEWDKPNTGKGAISVGTPQASHFNLFVIGITMIRFANKIPLLGAGVIDFNIPAVEPKVIMPHWKGKVTLHNAGHSGLKGGWFLTTARMKTV